MEGGKKTFLLCREDEGIGGEERQVGGGAAAHERDGEVEKGKEAKDRRTGAAGYFGRKRPPLEVFETDSVFAFPCSRDRWRRLAAPPFKHAASSPP